LFRRRQTATRRRGEAPPYTSYASARARATQAIASTAAQQPAAAAAPGAGDSGTHTATGLTATPTPPASRSRSSFGSVLGFLRRTLSRGGGTSAVQTADVPGADGAGGAHESAGMGASADANRLHDAWASRGRATAAAAGAAARSDGTGAAGLAGSRSQSYHDVPRRAQDEGRGIARSHRSWHHSESRHARGAGSFDLSGAQGSSRAHPRRPTATAQDNVGLPGALTRAGTTPTSPRAPSFSRVPRRLSPRTVRISPASDRQRHGGHSGDSDDDD